MASTSVSAVTTAERRAGSNMPTFSERLAGRKHAQPPLDTARRRDGDDGRTAHDEDNLADLRAHLDHDSVPTIATVLQNVGDQADLPRTETPAQFIGLERCDVLMESPAGGIESISQPGLNVAAKPGQTAQTAWMASTSLARPTGRRVDTAGSGCSRRFSEPASSRGCERVQPDEGIQNIANNRSTSGEDQVALELIHPDSGAEFPKPVRLVNGAQATGIHFDSVVPRADDRSPGVRRCLILQSPTGGSRLGPK